MGEEQLRMKRLLELARRGEPGEREAARKILDRLLMKAGISETDLESEVLVPCTIRFKTAQEKAILIQIVGVVTNKTRVGIRTYPGKKKVTFELTRAQAIDVNLMFTAYLDAWR